MSHEERLQLYRPVIVEVEIEDEDEEEDDDDGILMLPPPVIAVAPVVRQVDIDVDNNNNNNRDDDDGMLMPQPVAGAALVVGQVDNDDNNNNDDNRDDDDGMLVPQPVVGAAPVVVQVDNDIDNNNNNNNDDEGGVGGDEEEEDDENPLRNAEWRQIESMEHYIQKNGLEDVRYGAQSEVHLAEERQRLQEESDYQEDVHRSIFGAADESSSSSLQDYSSSSRHELLASIRDEHIDIETCKQVIRDVPLKPLAESCETLFALATFRSYQQEDDNSRRLSFSLKSFQHEAVEEFIAIMLGDKRPEHVPADCVVECCEISRYVQCGSVLEAMVDILMDSVDNANCVSLCQLADQLDLPRLFERSMSQMMQSIDSLQEHDLWNDFSPELQSRIVDMQTALRSSIHANVHEIFFSSMDEYLSIFAENVEYYRERLAEAKERQAEEDSVGRGWQDAQQKICNQERRLRTLELVFQDHKQMFGPGRRRRHSR